MEILRTVHSIASRCAGCTMPPTVELVPALPTQCCWALCFGPPQREVKGVSFPSSEVVEIPKLSEDDRAMKGREHQLPRWKMGGEVCEEGCWRAALL